MQRDRDYDVNGKLLWESAHDLRKTLGKPAAERH